MRRLVLIAPIPPRAGPDVHYEGRYSDEEFDARLDPEGVRRLEALRRQGLDRRDPALYCREHRAVHLPRIVVNRAALRTMRCDPCAFPNEWPDTLARRNTRLRADLERYDWTSRAASVEAPTLIVHGERDFNPVATAQEWASLIPDSRLVVVPRCGHLPWIDAPDVFFPAVHEFLSG